MKQTILFLIIVTLLITTVNAQEYIIKENDNANEFVIQEDIKKNLDITYSFESFNGFVANLDSEEYLQVLSDPRYDILPNHKFRTQLDNSIPQVNADDTWNLQFNATNMTGTYETVCVIDTGVDYTHENLGGCYGNNSANSSCLVLGGYDFINSDDDPLDDNGHGTHVTGIVASNHSTYGGVAPGVKIIAIKALNAAGNGNSADVAAGVDWCVANASKFNISVITMSIGSDTYFNTYCNANFPTLNTAIQAAIADNISVVISSGNCENTTVYQCHEGISGPSCITGVIPVGAVSDSDVITYQRGSLFQVLAPGVSITSTRNGGGTETRSGTSMAAPHVAGLTAILSQFYNLQSSLNISNETLVSALNTTDTVLNDTSGNNNNYSRINFLTALRFLDIVSPTITQISPANASSNASQNQTFVINITDLQIQNVTFNFWNITSLVQQNTTQSTVSELQYTPQVLNLTPGEYFWGVTSFDMNNNSFTTQNFTLTIASATIVNSPNNNTYTKTNETNFSCTSDTFYDTSLSNITFSLWNESDLVYNLTTDISGTTNTTIFNYTFINDSTYTWSCNTLNNESNLTTTGNYTITYDTTAPNLTIVSPLPSNETSDSVRKFFYFNTSDANINTTCALIYSASTQNSTVVTNYSETQELSRVLSPGNYTWKINCTDLAGNSNESGENSFTITEEEEDSGGSSGGGGGGGGGGGDSTTSQSGVKGSENNPVNRQELQDGFSHAFTRGKKIYLNDRFNKDHSITLNKITDKTAHITVQSDPINVSLQSGEVIKLNISNNQFYDIMLNATTITDSVAIILISEIEEPHPDYVPIELTTQNETQEEDDDIVEVPIYEKKKFPGIKVFVGIIIILIVLFIIYWIYTKVFKKHATAEQKINKEIKKRAKEEKMKSQNKKKIKKIRRQKAMEAAVKSEIHS